MFAYITSYVFMNHALLGKEQKENSILYEHLETFAPTVVPKLRLDEIRDLEIQIPEKANDVIDKVIPG